MAQLDHDSSKFAAPKAGAAEGCIGATAGARREVESSALLAGGRELLIRHAGETYTLRQTSKGKLILTK